MKAPVLTLLDSGNRSRGFLWNDWNSMAAELKSICSEMINDLLLNAFPGASGPSLVAVPG
jgi:hypothetical protein